MFSDRSQSIRMSSAVAKVAKPVMRGMHVQVTFAYDGCLFCFACTLYIVQVTFVYYQSYDVFDAVCLSIQF